MGQKPFWESLTLAEMNEAQWEALCDGCGKCCLVKLRDEDTDALAFTNLACRLLDCESCRCTDYPNRLSRVSDCVKLSQANLPMIDFMPPSCAYRRLQEGRGLPDWHPLISGTPDSVHQAGRSVRGRVVPETQITEADVDWAAHIVDWPEQEND